MKAEDQSGKMADNVANATINIGPREQLKRRVMGVVFLIIGAGLAFLTIAYNAPLLHRLVVFFPLWMAGLGLFQAREKT